MSVVNVAAKDNLAKLLSCENIFIRHKKVKTASFDTVSRILSLPTWKEMSSELYTMLIGHEVGHALWTARKRLDDIAKTIDPDNIEIAAAYINIVEDVRIERLIKSMYPGLRMVFSTAYADIFKRNFFGTENSHYQSRCFIDRANLYHKVGIHVSLSFTPEEQSFLDRMEQTSSFEDMIALTKEIYKWAQKNNQHPEPAELPQDLLDQIKEAIENGDVQFSDENEDEDDCEPGSGNEPSIKIKVTCESGGESNDDDNDGENEGKGKGKALKANSKGKKSGDESEEGEGACDGKGKNKQAKNPGTKQSNRNPKLKPVLPSAAPMPVTQQALDTNLEKYNDNNAKEIVYVSLPKPNLKNIIVDYKTVHSTIRSHYSGKPESIENAEKQFAAFKQINDDKINYLFTQFEMKKQADRYLRRKTNKTGSIDTLRLHAYKYEEDLFKSIATVTDAKNHALVFVIDWSGSMQSSMAGTIEQLINLTLFCRKAQIPFEVYSLTTGRGSGSAFEHKPGDLNYTDIFKMRNYLSSRMNAKEFTDACVNLFTFMPNGHFHDVGPISDHLIGCTPLDEAIITTIDLIAQIRTQTKAQVVNAVFLTDGGANTVSSYYSDGGYSSRMEYNHTYVLEDKLTHKQYEFNAGYQSMTPVMLEVLRDRQNIHAVGFHITNYSEYAFSQFEGGKESSKQMKKQFEESGYAICTSWGFNELYLIKGGENLRVKETSLQPLKYGAPVRPGSPEYIEAVTAKFMEQGTNTRKQRLLLDSFIKMIA